MSAQDAHPAKLPLLKELELVAKQSWRLILGAAAIGIVCAALSLQGSIYYYPVEMQATEIQATGGSSGGGGRLSQLSGLAGIANFSLPATQSAMQFQMFVDSLYSRDLADAMAKHEDILTTIYATQWDPSTRTWHEPPRGMLADVKEKIRSVMGLAPPTPWHPPNGENLHSFLSQALVVDQDPRKVYLVTLRLTTADREFSKRFLNLLTQTADERLRARALSRARTYIAYLSEKLPTVSIAEHREAIASALSEQERFAMAASSDTPFAAEIFQTPWGYNLPMYPSPRQTYILYTISGALLAMIFAFLRHRFHDQLQTSLWVRRLPIFLRRALAI